MKRPHLLYIAFWYPPSRASGVYRAIATSQAFVAHGWDVTVITTTTDFLEDEVGSTDDTLDGDGPAGVEVVRVPFTLSLPSDIDIRQLGWARANYPTIWKSLRSRSEPLRRAMSLIKGQSDQAHQLTDNYVSWIDPVVKTGIAAERVHPVDHILATGNPFSSFEVARILGGILGKGFSIDYRDPWTVDVFSGHLDHADRMTTEAERRIISESEACFHVNEAIANAYRLKFPEHATKHLVVPNGFDQTSVPPPSGPSRGPLRFGILGTMNDRWPMGPIFEAWGRLRDKLPSGSEMVLGGHLGYFERSQNSLEAYLPEESSGFQYVGPVAKEKVADFYDHIDVVILPVAGGAMVTSGKIYEAMALGKPFVCVQRTDGGARALAAGHPLGFGAEPEVTSVEFALLDAARAARQLDSELSQRIQQEAKPCQRSLAIQGLVDSVAQSTFGSLRV